MIIEWDLATFTAGDYTVEYEIESDVYKEWYENHYKQSEIILSIITTSIAKIITGV